ncbi:hypothetical protein Slin15195_G041060 [Septoria linicola]|uniref:DUF6924 domain-containing protein n=1 Tax=Septoria linicola TaxID=215465 RepID=A0A9Q9ARL7_9PEZI|nr:hypothetical protein Slin14017_G044590 [Septoria linicola]USW50787.1 hypothetical protein Slin15195_G041060 [Septoria linicola]
MAGTLFITAASADFKIVNRLLLHLRDWAHESGDRFYVVTSRDTADPDDQLSDLRSTETTQGDITAENWQNVWAGATIAELTAFCLEAVQKGTKRRCPGLFLALDEQGVTDETVIVFYQIFDSDIEISGPKLTTGDGFKKVRMPWSAAYLMWCNLEIANMNFEEFADNQEIPDDGGWYETGGLASYDGLDEQQHRNREVEIARFESEGRA